MGDLRSRHFNPRARHDHALPDRDDFGWLGQSDSHPGADTCRLGGDESARTANQGAHRAARHGSCGCGRADVGARVYDPRSHPPLPGERRTSQYAQGRHWWQRIYYAMDTVPVH